MQDKQNRLYVSKSAMYYDWCFFEGYFYDGNFALELYIIIIK